MDIENVVYLHNGVLFRYKKEIMPYSGKWMELNIIMLGEVSQTEKDRMFFNMWNLILKSE
jgi:hypothetical protein